MPDELRRTEDVPHDRLTRICDEMSKTFDTHPERHNSDKCIVFLDDGHQGGMVIYGYRDDTEAMAALLMHIQALFQANGKTLDLMFMDEDGIDRV